LATNTSKRIWQRPRGFPARFKALPMAGVEV
jgi:hypothetical protein